MSRLKPDTTYPGRATSLFWSQVGKDKIWVLAGTCDLMPPNVSSQNFSIFLYDRDGKIKNGIGWLCKAFGIGDVWDKFKTSGDGQPLFDAITKLIENPSLYQDLEMKFATGQIKDGYVNIQAIFPLGGGAQPVAINFNPFAGKAVATEKTKAERGQYQQRSSQPTPPASQGPDDLDMQDDIPF